MAHIHEVNFNPNPVQGFDKNAYQREWARNNHAKVRGWQHNYYQNNREQVIAKAVERNKAKYQEQKERWEFPYKTWYSAKDRARKAGIEFTITRESLSVPEFCPALGIPIDWSDKDHSASLDRIDNEKGYVPGNVIVVSYRANAAKRNLSKKDLKRLADFYASCT